MISASISTPNPIPAAVGAALPPGSGEAASIPGAADFLAELQAAAQGLVPNPDDLTLAAKPDSKEPPAEEPPAELQNLPTLDAATLVSTAIFAAPILTASPAHPEAVSRLEALSQAAVSPVSAVPQEPPLQVPSAPSEVATDAEGQPVMTAAQPASADAQHTPAMPSSGPLDTPEMTTTERMPSALPPPVEAPAVEMGVSMPGSPTPDAATSSTVAEHAREFASMASAKPDATPQKPAESAVGASTVSDAVSVESGHSAEFKTVAAQDAPAAGDEQAKSIDTSDRMVSTGTAGEPSQASSLLGVNADSPANVLATSTGNLVTHTQAPPLSQESLHRAPLEPHQMRLDAGPVQVEVLKLVREGGGQIVLELTPPDQGTYRLDLRLDSQGQAHLMVEGVSDSVRTRLEQGESGLRDQLSQMGLQLQLSYREQGGTFASQDSGPDASATPYNAQGSETGALAEDGASGGSRARGDRGLVHLYA